MTLVAIDMDGTLLSRNGTISNENIQAIHDMEQLGHHIAICSGRSHSDIQQILQKNGIRASIISGNGAMVYNNRFIKQLFIPYQTLNEIMTFLKEYNIMIELYSDSGILMEENFREKLYDEIEQVTKKNQMIQSDLYFNQVEIILKQNSISFVKNFNHMDYTKLKIYKINGVTFNPDKRSMFLNRIKYRTDFSLTSGSIATVELGHKQTNKGFGLKYLANHLQIPMEKTLAIGDNFNDIPMFRVAGRSIAMANAEEALKNIAIYITDDNNHNGVAKALRKYLGKVPATLEDLSEIGNDR